MPGERGAELDRELLLTVRSKSKRSGLFPGKLGRGFGRMSRMRLRAVAREWTCQGAEFGFAQWVVRRAWPVERVVEVGQVEEVAVKVFGAGAGEGADGAGAVQRGSEIAKYVQREDFLAGDVGGEVNRCSPG
jgi:hypothetical protein